MMKIGHNILDHAMSAIVLAMGKCEENESRRQNGETAAYTEGGFFGMARRIERDAAGALLLSLSAKDAREMGEEFCIFMGKQEEKRSIELRDLMEKCKEYLRKEHKKIDSEIIIAANIAKIIVAMGFREENLSRAQSGESPAYIEYHFHELAGIMSGFETGGFVRKDGSVTPHRNRIAPRQPRGDKWNIACYCCDKNLKIDPELMERERFFRCPKHSIINRGYTLDGKLERIGVICCSCGENITIFPESIDENNYANCPKCQAKNEMFNRGVL